MHTSAQVRIRQYTSANVAYVAYVSIRGAISLGFCVHRAMLFNPGHLHQLTSSGWQLGWFLLWLIPCLFGDTGIEPTELDLWSTKNPISPFLPLNPETRNLRRFLTSGFKGKNGAMGFSLIMCLPGLSPSPVRKSLFSLLLKTRVRTKKCHPQSKMYRKTQRWKRHIHVYLIQRSEGIELRKG